MPRAATYAFDSACRRFFFLCCHFSFRHFSLRQLMPLSIELCRLSLPPPPAYAIAALPLFSAFIFDLILMAALPLFSLRC
jgi:hypothetical protein